MFNLFKPKPPPIDEEKLYDGMLTNWAVDTVLDRAMAKYGITKAQIDKVKTTLDLIKTVDRGDSVEITITIKK
jgi:hypothetical protein